MTETAIVAAVVRADMIVCAALRVARIAASIGLGLAIGHWMQMRKSDGHTLAWFCGGE